MEGLIDILDKAFEEQTSMNSRLIRSMEENHGLQDSVNSLLEENPDLKKLLESMDLQLRLANEAKLHKDKRLGRKSETAKSLKLKDGYNTYKRFEGETEENFTRTCCMAYVRRKFLETLVRDERSRPFI